MSVTSLPAAARVLVADDQADVVEAVRLLLKLEGYEVDGVGAPGAVVAALSRGDHDVALIDLNYARDTTSGREGLDLLAEIRRLDPTLPVVVMTAWGTVDIAVEAMRRGAGDFVQKPWENARLLAVIRTQLELGRAVRRSRRLEAENQWLRTRGSVPLVARSPAMQPVLQVLSRVGPSDANVLITGENGTGKSLLAQALHDASPRAAAAFVSVNTGGVSETLVDSELFGHERGAFTDARAERLGRFEVADGGTLFLDEIANMPGAVQARLLRVLETREFERLGSSRTRRADVRVLAATNADLQAEVEAGRFRQDLLFRLNTVEVHMPPLRERREDIPDLAALFLGRHTRRYRKAIDGFEPAALQALLDHGWPGNIRELDHAVERAVLMADGPTIPAAALALRPPRDGGGRLDDMSLEDVEAFLIRKALDRHGRNVTAAAHALGLSRSALYRRLQRYGLS
ncbi:sigma-54 dependent transcriptional regulator [Luteitalea sp.]|uniref:sigma-54-dependent transcriptional regulator n=1 Tax=Luteitalea sp. TaxID=2004800 RepID=UPI0025BAF6BB|nr:sigma-54 dependent transcriptional regulator [Luteitalea sp.]